jgi:hypothetical protein
MDSTKHVSALDDEMFNAYLKEFADDATRRISIKSKPYVNVIYDSSENGALRSMIARLIEAGETMKADAYFKTKNRKKSRRQWSALVAEVEHHLHKPEV